MFPVGLDVGGMDLDEALAGGPAMGRVAEAGQGAVAGDSEAGSGLRPAAVSERRDGIRGWPAGRNRSSDFNYLGRFATARGGLVAGRGRTATHRGRGRGGP